MKDNKEHIESSEQIQYFLQKIQKTQDIFLQFVESQEDEKQDIKILVDELVHPYDFEIFLRFLSNISNNYHPKNISFNKFAQLLLLFKERIQQSFSNSTIFDIFKNNKRIILFLIEEKILTIDKTIYQKMMKKKFYTNNYLHYFYPEIKDFMSTQLLKVFSNELPEDFYEKRRKGENDAYICELIRNDSIDEFIVYLNKQSVSLDLHIDQSIYETNSLLNDFHHLPSLIEYSAFFGSIQIFKYLQVNHATIDKSIWTYAIHGGNYEIIHIIEELQLFPPNNDFKEYFIESIKCHHNDIANYIKTNYFNNFEDQQFVQQYLKYYNFDFIESENVNQNSFYYLCHYDYKQLVDILVKDKNINVNRRIFKNTRNRAPFIDAIERENIEMIKILLKNEKLDVNLISVDKIFKWSLSLCFNEIFLFIFL